MPKARHHRNNGLRKICGCPRRGWPKCSHAWHFNFHWKGTTYRLSLDKHAGKHLDSKTAAEGVADTLRTEIRENRFGTALPQLDRMTLADLFKTYTERKLDVERPERKAADKQQIDLITRTVLPTVPEGERPFGEWLVCDITTDTLERFREVRSVRGRVAANRNLACLSALFNWAVRMGYVDRTPFKRGTERVVGLTEETARHRRLEPGEAEALLAVCGPHLRALVEAAIETGCRQGELLSLQWQQIRDHKIFLPAGKTKTKKPRAIPISTRLQAILEMRRLAPDGKEHPATGYVFGNEIGQRAASFKTAWRIAVLKAHGFAPVWRKKPRQLSVDCLERFAAIDLHFHDLRREAGSRWLDGGVPIQVVRDWLGHENVSQTSTYLASTASTQEDAMRQYETRLQKLANPSRRGGRKSPRTAGGVLRKAKKNAVGRDRAITLM